MYTRNVTEENTKYLEMLPYYEHLTEEQREMVRQNSMMKDYAAGTTIHGSGDSCLGMIYLLKGGIRVYILSDEGREITLFHMGKDDSCVLSAACVMEQLSFETQMVAEKDCSLFIVRSKAFGRLTQENVYVKCFMYELMTERFSLVMWTMQQILFERFDKRLASFLLSECSRTGEQELHMTHEQIAQHVNSAREVVARMLKRFALDGLVEVKRGYLIIKDAERLKNLL